MEAIRLGAIDGLQKWAEDVEEASRPDVPVSPNDGGFMRDSAEVTVDAFGLQSAVSYYSPPKREDGRAPAKIGAVAMVHENLYARHEHGHAKFLEKALQTRAPQGLAHLAAALKARLR
jgi:hypothetical protein